MGKIRIKALGDEKKEKAQKQRDQARREGKKIAKLKDKDGGRVVEMEGVEVPEQETLPLPSQTSPQPSPTRKGSTQGEVKKRERSQRYIKARSFIDKTKSYTLADALELVKKTGLAKFDPTVELHINTVEKGIKGNVVLPHGVGRELKVAIVDDKLLKEIETGKIDFDVLISHPSFMPKLAKLAKILGPKGLMPNPKNGTISDKPEETAKKFKGTLQFKTEGDFPIIHTVIGKGSFPDQKLEENFQALINAIGFDKIRTVYIKTTMSPSVKVEI